MKNSKLVTYFYDNLIDWFGEKNDWDCETFGLNKQSDVSIDFYKEKFRIKSNEIILFARDTSMWNSCSQGIVMTNIGIYYIKSNKKPVNRQVIQWTNIDNVRFIKKYSAFRFKLKDGAKIPDIYFYAFFKSKDKKKLNSEIGPLLANEIVKLASLVTTKKKKGKTSPKTQTRKNGFFDGVIISSGFSEAEQLYLKEYYKYIKINGAIDESKHNELEQLRASLGLSKTSAQQAEEDLKDALLSSKDKNRTRQHN